MKAFAAALALFVAAIGARGQAPDTSSGSQGSRGTRQTPSAARPTREEMLEAQRRGRIRDRDVPDRIRGQLLHELEVPNPAQLEEILKNPYRHRQDDLKT